MEPRRPYLAVHSQGLGHASRAIALARGLRDVRPDLDFLFLAGSPALDLAVASGFDVMTAPPVPDWRATDGVMGPAWRWYADYGRYLRVARSYFRREVDWPDARFLLSDGELASVAEAVRRHVPTVLVVHRLRHDFARDPVSRLAESWGNAWFSRLAQKVDLILTLERAPAARNVRTIGPIVRPFTASRETLRDDLVFRKRTILVTAGGTPNGEFLIRKTIEAYRRLALDDTSLVVVSGPKLKVQAEPGVYVYGFVPNLQDLVLAADLVVTTAGKGTVNEALAAGTPIIAIPPKGHAEAERNAARLGSSWEDLDRLGDLIEEKLRGGRLPPIPTGNDEAVRILREFLESRGR